MSSTHGYYLERNADAAAAFLRELDRAVESIARNPERWPRFEHGTHHKLFRNFPYMIVYRVRGPRVDVIALAHQKRRPGYWAKRRQSARPSPTP
ncbi:MAG: type II toxin-antitoxin system RelE/ParE family toxin [Sandaracinaceae bacterium]|nr:type II toxin-antitoxin system RelE/ParE family toxin [Sandaracinaceae bacterium]